MNFGTSYSAADTKPCIICKGQVPRADQVVVDALTLHKNCFKCAYCGAALKHGSCAQIRTQVGTRWYCSGPATKACALLDTSEREKKLKK